MLDLKCFITCVGNGSSVPFPCWYNIPKVTCASNFFLTRGEVRENYQDKEATLTTLQSPSQYYPPLKFSNTVNACNGGKKRNAIKNNVVDVLLLQFPPQFQFSRTESLFCLLLIPSSPVFHSLLIHMHIPTYTSDVIFFSQTPRLL